jgi:hypothetical protein
LVKLVKIKYVADPNYNRLVKQYNGLVDKYTEQNIHKDSIKIDDIGYVNIIDTVSENLLLEENILFIKIPNYNYYYYKTF